MMRLLSFLSIWIASAIWTPASAGQFEDGLAAAKRGDFATAIRLWRPLAEKGDADAQYSLGVMYINGEGVPKDNVAAVTWYQKAAEQGHSTAQYDVGYAYIKGEGVPQDYVSARTWLRKAAEQGEARAMFNLGTMYRFGYGVPIDYVQAHKWYNLAAAATSAVATAEVRTEAVRYRNDLANEMTPTQIAEAQRLASDTKPKGWQRWLWWSVAMVVVLLVAGYVRSRSPRSASN